MADLQQEIIDRLKAFLKSKKDKDVAGLISLSPQDFYNRKKRDTLLTPITTWAISKKMNLNWVIAGKGSKYLEGITDENVWYYDAVKEVLESNDRETIKALKQNIKRFHRLIELEEKELSGNKALKKTTKT